MSKLWKSLGGLTAGAVAAYVLFIRPWHFRWGTTEEESAARLAGDDLVPEPRLQTTHAVTIQAAPSEVWPWIVQLGQGRGGFYSYDTTGSRTSCGSRSTARTGS